MLPYAVRARAHVPIRRDKRAFMGYNYSIEPLCKECGMLVYFAHPAFTAAQERVKMEFLERLSARLAQLERGRHITIIDPFLYAPVVETDTAAKLAMSATIKNACIGLLENCDVLLALTDDNDTGTAFEAGYAHCVNMPIILVSSGSCDTANAMLLGAARERFDNILDDEPIAMLALLLITIRAEKTGTSEP